MCYSIISSSLVMKITALVEKLFALLPVYSDDRLPYVPRGAVQLYRIQVSRLRKIIMCEGQR